MNRRELLKSTATVAPALFLTTFVAPARAIAPPVVVAIAGVFFSVAFRRYVVGALMERITNLMWFTKIILVVVTSDSKTTAAMFGIATSNY